MELVLEPLSEGECANIIPMGTNCFSLLMSEHTHCLQLPWSRLYFLHGVSIVLLRLIG